MIDRNPVRQFIKKMIGCEEKYKDMDNLAKRIIEHKYVFSRCVASGVTIIPIPPHPPSCRYMINGRVETAYSKELRRRINIWNKVRVKMINDVRKK